MTDFAQLTFCGDEKMLLLQIGLFQYGNVYKRDEKSVV